MNRLYGRLVYLNILIDRLQDRLPLRGARLYSGTLRLNHRLYVLGKRLGELIRST